MSDDEICGTCGGTGEQHEDVTCRNCGGSGEIQEDSDSDCGWEPPDPDDDYDI